MACQFSEDGKYFARLTQEGKLEIWNTFSNAFEQEFTPDFQLTSPCTCLHFISSRAASKPGSPRKKKRRESLNESCIALGTSSGQLLLYSITKGDLECVIDSKTSQTVNCVSSNKDEFIFSGTDTNILVWNLRQKSVSSKWFTGNEKVTTILVITDSDQLLTASKSIKLWSISTKEVLKTYTGHSSPVTLLYYVKPKDDTSDSYFISGSKGDRLLSCWSLNENKDGKSSIANFLLEDIVNNVSVTVGLDGTTHIAATVRNGVVHVYHLILNGKKSNKPLKPKTTIQVVADSKENEVVSPMYITAATYRNHETLCICHGSSIVQTFEDITISGQKLQCLLRQDIRKRSATKENNALKVRTPVVGNDVHYLSSQTSTVITKRKHEGKQEIPMEKRLENLMVNEGDSTSKVPQANNMAQLLIQGLHSKDKNILRTVLTKKDEQLVKNTIKRVPAALISPLFEELTRLVKGKTLARQIGLIWMKNLILIHSGLLLSNPDLPTFFGEALGCIEAGLALQAPRNKLMGRLELLVSQISSVSQQETEDNEALLVFNDKVDSDSEDDGMGFDDSSDNEWKEENSEGEDNGQEVNSDIENSDEVMSS